jgi:hypothetical protein
MKASLLSLDTTKIVFLHPDDTGLAVPYAVQIDVKAQERRVHVVEF